jgi:hypothetical protein
MRVICQFKILTVIVLTFFVMSSKGQIYQQMPQYGYTGPRFNMDSTLSIPTVCGVPTLKSNLIKKAAIAFDSCNNKFYQYNPKTFAWSEITGGGGATDTTNKFVNNIEKVNDSTLKFYKGSSNTNLVLSNGRFKKDIILSGASTNRLGVWTNGQTIPVAGMDLDSAFKVITQIAVAPTYNQPTLSISNPVGNSPGNYEIGSALTINIQWTATLNDSRGIISGYIYRNTPSAGVLTNYPTTNVTDNVTSLTATRQYYNFGSFDSANCKLNNLGQLDCRGNFARPTNKTSSIITYTPYPKRYWGYVNSTSPTSSEIITNLGGGNELMTDGTRAKSGFSVVVSGTNQYVYYAYPTTYGTLTSIIVGGFESIGAFTRTTVSVTNAVGYTQNYYLYRSNNQFTNTTVTFTSVN